MTQRCVKLNRKGSKTTGIEPFVIECMCLRLKEKEALSYLDDRGYSISAKEYYRIKQEVKDSSNKRLNHIASEEFLMQHLDRIENLKTIEGELWNQFHIEKSPINKSKILMHIADIQQYLAAFYDSTSFIMQQGARIRKQQQSKEVNNG